MKRFAQLLFLLLVVLTGIFFLYPEGVVKAGQWNERRASGLDVKTATVDDHQFTYLERANDDTKDQATIVLVHGFSADKSNWTRMTQHLPGYRLVVPDLAGHGDTTFKEDATYSIAKQAERLRKLLNQLKISKPHIIGNSMGGHIVGYYAATWPDEIGSVTFMNNAGISAPIDSPFVASLKKGENPLIINQASDYATLINYLFTEEPWIPNHIKTYLGEQSMARKPKNEKVFRDLRANPAPLEPLLPKITAPAFVIWGTDDNVFHQSTVDVMKRIQPKLQVALLEGCGHAPMIERPAESARLYHEFITRISKTDK